ncbi:MAG TPA: hypothetical protein VN605_10135 [Thermoanaerobaculia bacterium]|nr:hypothetical protein [Thermoanaerobaculia bacterium]
MMISPGAIALTALTLMLWILWRDSMRSRRPGQIIFTVRIALFLVVSGVLLLNLVRYPYLFSTTARVTTVLSALVGIAGATYFGRRLIRRI